MRRKLEPALLEAWRHLLDVKLAECGRKVAEAFWRDAEFEGSEGLQLRRQSDEQIHIPLGSVKRHIHDFQDESDGL